MSRSERDKARARALEIKAAESKARKRSIVIAVGAALAVVAAIIAAVVALGTKSDGVSAVRGSDGLDHVGNSFTAEIPEGLTEGGGISLGKGLKAGTSNEGAPQVDIFFDYMCSHCSHLEDEYGEKLLAAADAGDITLVYHPVAIMDETLSPRGVIIESYVASAEPESFAGVHTAMHENLAKKILDGEITDYPSIEEIVGIAKKGGLSDKGAKGLAEALEDDTWATFAEDVRKQFAADSVTYRDDGSIGTPTVFIDGKHESEWSSALSQFTNK